MGTEGLPRTAISVHTIVRHSLCSALPKYNHNKQRKMGTEGLPRTAISVHTIVRHSLCSALPKYNHNKQRKMGTEGFEPPSAGITK
jgi:hypothetical protein